MKRQRESGYALLFVSSMAAVLAIMLFLELPRAAFEAQRDREQLLVDRGQQYSRAVALYVRKFNTYPPSMDALDNTQNLRFLRAHYVDPMTGKDEWRLIHVGPGGVFTDSLVYGKKKDDQQSAPQNFITELQQTGGNQLGATQGVNIAARQRPSDIAGAPGDPNNPQLNLPPPQPGLQQPGFPQPGFPQQGVPLTGGQQQPGMTPFGTPQVDINGQPVAIPPAAQPGFQGQQPGMDQLQANAGQPGFNGFQPGIQPPQTTQAGFGSNPFMPAQAGANQPAAPQPAGANLINQLLTSPRPGGMPGLTGQMTPPSVDQYGNPVPGNPLTGGSAATGTAAAATANAVQAAPQVVGGGIAGVASKREQEGIKLYNEKKKYNEWEFVYDISKDPSRGGMAGQTQAAGQAGQQQSQQTQQSQQNQQQTPNQFQQFQQQQLQQGQQQFPQQTPQPGLPVPQPSGPGLAPPSQ